MELTLEKIKLKTKEEKPCQVTFSVRIPAEVVIQRQEEVTKEFQKDAQLPGFRPGKVPLDLIQKNFSEKIKSRAVDLLIKDSVPQILKEKSVIPLFTPFVEELNLDPKSSLSFNLIVERNPNFKVKNYKNIPLEKNVKKIIQADVDAELNNLRERNAQLVPSSAAAIEKSHFAVLDFSATYDGKPLPDMKTENYLIDCSNPQTIQGFAEGILGMKKGETKEISVPFPPAHPRKELAGKTVAFHVNLKEIKEKSLPNLDDEFAKDLGTQSLAELKTTLEKALKKRADESTHAQMEKKICDHLVHENEIPLPATLVQVQLGSMIKDNLLREFGHKLDLENLPPEAVERKKTLTTELKTPAERAVRLSYIISAIKQEEKLFATEEDWENELEESKKLYPKEIPAVEKSYIENKEKILRRLTENKVFKFLLDNAKVKEVA